MASKVGDDDVLIVDKWAVNTPGRESGHHCVQFLREASFSSIDRGVAISSARSARETFSISYRSFRSGRSIFMSYVELVLD